jgi:hypothetical protein
MTEDCQKIAYFMKEKFATLNEMTKYVDSTNHDIVFVLQM